MKEQALRIASIVVLVLLLILGAWGIIVLAVQVPGILSGIGRAVSSPFAHVATTSAPSSETASVSTALPERLVAEAPTSTIPSGNPFTLSWTHSGGTSSYGYTISYSCSSGLSLEAQLPNGSYQKVACNTPFNYGSSASSAVLRPQVTTGQNATTQFTVASRDLATNSTTSQGIVAATFSPLPGQTSPSQSTGYYGQSGTSGTAARTGYASNPSGVADISVRILSAVRGSVQFEIRNSGTKTAPAGWYFTATLPNTSAPYTSAPQQALTPGGYIVYTLGYPASAGAYQQNCGYATMYTGTPYPGYPSTYACYGGYNGYSAGGTFSVTADPQGFIPDQNRANNTASAVIY